MLNDNPFNSKQLCLKCSNMLFFLEDLNPWRTLTMHIQYSIISYNSSPTFNLLFPYFFTLWKWVFVVVCTTWVFLVIIYNASRHGIVPLFHPLGWSCFHPIGINHEFSSMLCYIPLWFNHVLSSCTFHTKTSPTKCHLNNKFIHVVSSPINGLLHCLQHNLY